MVGLGFGFIGLTLLASFLRWRGTLWNARPLLWVFVFAVVGAVAANQFGWVSAEVGRQPWIVHPPIVRDAAGDPALDANGHVLYETVTVRLADGTTIERVAGLRTDDGVSKVVEAEEVVTSIVLFGSIYLLLGALWVLVLHRKIQHGPDPIGDRPPGATGGTLEAAATRAGGTGLLVGEGDPAREGRA
jgi:cytochrome d ubiquinol oxidase subunit I